MAVIAGLLSRGEYAVNLLVRRHGGMAPPARVRSGRALTMAEREQISRGLCHGDSIREIARTLHRAASSICREVRRHGGRERYRASDAEEKAQQNALRPKACRLAVNRGLQAIVASKLALQWSPEQVSGWLAARYADDQSMRVSTETIYRSLFIQTRGVLKKQLMNELRTGRMLRYPMAQNRHGKGRRGLSRLREAVSIKQRPPEADDRAVPGHWEGDLLAGTTKSHIATLVERRSRFVMLVKIAARDSATVVKALARRIHKLPAELRRSLTWDRGAEMGRHREFTVDTKVQVYFCDPHSPWQRGTNENTNALLRQYFPRGQSLSGYSQAQLNAVALRLNQRPRKTLGYQTPSDVFNQTVATTG
jgi:IS30 family transposase